MPALGYGTKCPREGCSGEFTEVNWGWRLDLSTENYVRDLGCSDRGCDYHFREVVSRELVERRR